MFTLCSLYLVKLKATEKDAAMRLKIEKIGNALHPNEVVVGIATAEGRQRLVVDRHSLGTDETLEIGWPLRHEGAYALIELPRETSTGAWRVWVPAQSLVEVTEGAA